MLNRTKMRKAKYAPHLLLEENLTLFPKVSECIKLLQSDSNLPIQRARMRIKLSLPVVDAEKLRPKVLEAAEKVEHDATGPTDWEIASAYISHLFTC